MKIRFFLITDDEGNPDILWVTPVFVGKRPRATALFHAARDEYERQARVEGSGVTKLREGAFLLRGQLP